MCPTRKEISVIVEELCKSPFLWMGFCLLIIEKLSHYLIAADHFITLFWANQFYLVFYIPAFYLTRTLFLSPYNSATKLATLNKKNRHHILLKDISISLLLILETLFFILEVILLMAAQQEEIITKKELFTNAALAVKLVVFIGIPSVTITFQLSIRKTLVKDGYAIDKIEYDKILSRAWMCFIILLILAEFFSFTTSENYYTKLLNWFLNYIQPIHTLSASVAIIISFVVIFFIKRNRQRQKTEHNNS
ncbi:MAG: hypothetical protein QXN55_08945 [Candidatus Nitrosotenuis sp.]